MSVFTQKTLLVLLAFLSIYIVWGTTFLAISYGLSGFPPFILAGLRFFVAGILLLMVLYFKGAGSYARSGWTHNMIPGIMILTVGVGAVTWAEQYLSSTEAAIVTASEPFWFILMDKKNRKFYLGNKLAIGGLVTGFLGLLLFFRDSLGAVAGMQPMRHAAFLILLLSALVWVLGSLYSKRVPGASLFMNVAQQLVIGGLASLAFATIRGEWGQVRWDAIPARAWAGLVYLVVFGSVIAYLSFIWLLSVKPAALVSTHTFVNPVVAVAAGWLLAGEKISREQGLALSVILAGVIVTNVVQYKLSGRTRVKIRRTARGLIAMGSPYKRGAPFSQAG